MATASDAIVVPRAALAIAARSSAENSATIDFAHLGTFMMASQKSYDRSPQTVLPLSLIMPPCLSCQPSAYQGAR